MKIDHRSHTGHGQLRSGDGLILSGFALPISQAQSRQLANMGVAIVSRSALTPCPDGMVGSFDPPAARDVIVIVAAPHDDLVRRFVADLKRRGLPAAPVKQLQTL
jgi:hypothetical protein